ncbi:MAG: DUF2207 domain-containing protein [Ignavibacteriaceae bacterium]
MLKLNLLSPSKIFLFLLLLQSFLFGKEKILSFNSDITINPDASMIVSETIAVITEGDLIKHGIYRDFPTNYKDIYGNNITINFEIIKILRDGRTDDYRVESLSNGKRIYIGNKNYFLTGGIHTYTIEYKTNRQLGFFKDHDELYWNVTGNGWAFNIDKVSAMVHLPPNIPSNEINCVAFTGSYGSRGRDYNNSKSISTAVFNTNRILGAREGLTIVVEWPKGFVNEPTAEAKFRFFISDNLDVLIGLIGLFIVLVYYLLIWKKVGKDPGKGTIIPQYVPPDNFSPAAMRYIKHMGYDNKTFAASIINMAVKGYLSIKEDDGKFILIREKAGAEILTPDEKKIASKLIFNSNHSAVDYEEVINQIKEKVPIGNSFLNKAVKALSSRLVSRLPQNAPEQSDKKQSILELDQKNHTIISASIKELKKALKNSYEKIYFLNNRKEFIVGAILSIIFVVILGILGSPNQTFIIIWLSMWSIGVTFLIITVYKAWLGVAGAGKIKVSGIIGALVITGFAIPFFLGELAGIYFLSTQGSYLTPIILAALVFINILFYHLLKAPTLAGRKLLDKIEGFKMYLSVAEKDRLNIINSPEKTPQLFEKYLPYALALDVENDWALQFASVINTSSIEKSTYHPGWYSGSSWNNFSADGFTSSFCSSFSSAISSSSTAPGSSSGSGGSSGGGGGGGGGGGW